MDIMVISDRSSSRPVVVSSKNSGFRSIKFICLVFVLLFVFSIITSLYIGSRFIAPTPLEYHQELSILEKRNKELTRELDSVIDEHDEVSDYFTKELADLSTQADGIQRQSMAIADSVGLDIPIVKSEYGKIENAFSDKSLDFQGGGTPLSGQFDILKERLEGFSVAVDLAGKKAEKSRMNKLFSYLDKPVEDSWLSSQYGFRDHPITGDRTWHNGVDFAGRMKDDVLSISSGVVIASSYHSGHGNYIKVKHKDGYVSKYSHLHERSVDSGDKVQKGDVIGLLGSTGRSTGPHVHLEIHDGDQSVNPQAFLNENEAVDVSRFIANQSVSATDG